MIGCVLFEISFAQGRRMTFWEKHIWTWSKTYQVIKTFLMNNISLLSQQVFLVQPPVPCAGPCEMPRLHHLHVGQQRVFVLHPSFGPILQHRTLTSVQALPSIWVCFSGHHWSWVLLSMLPLLHFYAQRMQFLDKVSKWWNWGFHWDFGCRLQCICV